MEQRNVPSEFAQHGVPGPVIREQFGISAADDDAIAIINLTYNLTILEHEAIWPGVC